MAAFEDSVLQRALSPRQRQICEAILAGCGNGEIAQRLGIDVDVLKGNLHRLFVAFAVRNRRQLAYRLLVHYGWNSGSTSIES